MKIFIGLISILLSSCSGGHGTHQHDDSATVVISPKVDTLSDYEENDHDTSWAAFSMTHRFANYPAEMFSGKLMDPDYRSVSYGKDAAFQAYLEEQLKGQGVNFGGHYTIVEGSCGAMCVSFHMVDRISGKICVFPTTGDGLWGYHYEPNSTLLIGNSTLLNEQMTKYLYKWDIQPQFYRWTGTKFTHLP